MRRLLPLLLLGLALAGFGATSNSSANPTTRCGLPGYSYAGVGALRAARGVAADLRAAQRPVVRGGHVAAWVGLGGYGAGKGGTDAWIQAGIITKEGQAPSLYYEVTRPGYKPRLVPLRAAAIGRSYRISVQELVRPGWWRVYVDGRAVSRPVSLPGSHGRWQPTATAESWDGGSTVCNRFGFDFARVSVLGARWQPFQTGFTLRAPGYRVTKRTTTSFLAAS